MTCVTISSQKVKQDGITIKPRFNPEGWFGSSWTRDEKRLKHKIPFDSKYREVLERSAKSSYAYKIRSEYLHTVRQVLEPSEACVAV